MGRDSNAIWDAAASGLQAAGDAVSTPAGAGEDEAMRLRKAAGGKAASIPPGREQEFWDDVAALKAKHPQATAEHLERYVPAYHPMLAYRARLLPESDLKPQEYLSKIKEPAPLHPTVKQ